MSDILLVHSSDLHLRPNGTEDELRALRRVIDTARDLGADVVLLAGDVFDANGVPSSLVEAAAALIAESASPVVILPGNHDCLTDDSVYHHPDFAGLPDLHVFGVSEDGSVVFEHLDLEVWGQPHVNYRDMRPLGDPRPRSTRWQVAMAHGHWVTRPEDRLRSWLISDEEISASGADYVALGHWELAQPAGDGTVSAYYSGSPGRAGTVNVIRLAVDGAVEVIRVPLPVA